MLTEVIENIKFSAKPVVKQIQKKKGTQILAIGLGRGVELKEHTAPCKATLLVVKGEIDFNTSTESLRFASYESYDIPLNVRHSVVAYDDAVFLLFLNDD